MGTRISGTPSGLDQVYTTAGAQSTSSGGFTLGASPETACPHAATDTSDLALAPVWEAVVWLAGVPTSWQIPGRQELRRRSGSFR